MLTHKTQLDMAAADSAGCHRDAILTLASVNLSSQWLISASRDGAVKRRDFTTASSINNTEAVIGAGLQPTHGRISPNLPHGRISPRHSRLTQDFAKSVDRKFKVQGEEIIKFVSRMLKDTTAALDGLIFARIDGARAELSLDVEQIRAELERGNKEEPFGKRASSSAGKEVGDGREALAANPLGFDKSHWGRVHHVYVPPPVRGVYCG
ncbi:hypothetical protein ZWY2020_011149 [Hordeum vulgare]|nr:hypothetical protein ZWY2020_011149 [Hordeum vulgare]